MRAAILLVMVAAAVLAIATGCAGSANGATTTSAGATATSTTLAPATSTTAAPTTSTTAARLSWGDIGNWQAIAVTAAAPEVDAQPESVNPGDKVVFCLIKMVNKSKTSFDYNGLDFTLFDTGHQEYDNFGLSSMPDFGTGTLAPGESAEGAVAFELPEGATPAGLEWQPETAPSPALIWGQP